MRKIITLALIVCIALSVLSACGSNNEPISKEDAQKIVLEDLGVTADAVTMHTHITTYENAACYSIYVTVNGKTLEYIIDSQNGQVLSVSESQHSH